MSLRSLSCLLAISCSTLLHAAEVPTFAGPTPGTLRSISIPTVDISRDAARHVIIARGTEKEYQGHCDTVLMADGRTMFTAWCMNHAGHLGPLARSDDTGLTWTAPLPTPPDWQLVKMTTPVLHRLADPRGIERLFIFGGCDFPGNLRSAFSTDLGKTWSPMKELGLVGEVAPKSILSFDDGKRLIMWSDRRDPTNAKDPHPVVWQSESLDGGLTWSQERVILVVPGQWAQPSVTRSDDGKQLVMLMRENTRQHHSLYSVSTDDARTWSEPKELPAALTGDRHVIKHAPDGRLVIAFRDMAKASSTYGHYVAWVGTFEDIVNRREGQYRIKLLRNAKRTPADLPGTGNTDCGYSDLELLGDGTLIATTYIHYAAGPEKSSVVSTRFTLSETDALAKQPSASTGSLLPTNWDSALAGDIVMRRLVNTSAPQVKGAHDAEFVCVGEKAYLVAEANDVKAGESAGWPFIYATMSIVNLNTLKTERVIDFAKSEQVFENETLPVGACFVPRILQKDADTLRCYFTSEDPGKRQSQMWYRDFDLKRGEFAPTIHKARLKTAAGTFDFQPQYFHADAAAQGFAKKAVDSAFFIFDSFKRFDSRLYVALNNFSGKQNALSLVHDDLETFEVLGHYNEPQAEQLSESAVNRLPDGTWMAICRNDKGNYHFTTSGDGRTWAAGREMPQVPNGANSKPTFDQFGGVYYLGWQEATKIQGVSRSVFNVDISRDGKVWERKYRFETPKSFQYPTFHEHEGVTWLCVTQGDSSPSRKERIMFGKLEDVGQFESQDGKQRIEWPAPVEEPAVMKVGVKLFTDRDYTLTEAPEFLMGRSFLRTSIEGYEIECVKPGELFVMTVSQPHTANQSQALKKAGFLQTGPPEFQLFPGEVNRVTTWRRVLNPGDVVAFHKLALPVLGEGLKVKLVRTLGQKTETPEEAAARIAEMEEIADHALVPPVLNTSPLPKYDYEQLDYGMTIGIERTPGGRLWACWVAGGDSPDAYFVLATSDDDGQTWSKPRLVLDSHDDTLPRKRSILVGNLWTDPLGRLWLIFDQSMDMFDGRAGVWATICENPDADEPVWSAPRRIWHGVTLNKPTVLSTGEWMLPVSLDQRGGFGPFKGCFAELDAMRGANVFVSLDNGQTWERRGMATFPNPDWHEHMIVERRDGSLWMLARTGKGMMESVSTDGGRTWSQAVDSAIKNPNARFFIRRLASGRLLLIKHGDQIDAHEGRVQLSAWLSDDDGKSWKGGLVLDERKGISYPDGFQAPDGTIYISYDRNRAKDGEILLARFIEDDVMAKNLVGPKSKLKMLISRPLAKFTKPESAFTPIFDGKSFDGWEQSGNWVIEDGAFYRNARGGSLKYTAARLPDDFELRFDWKVSEGCNSGVYYRPGQVEYQVLDNAGSPYGENARQAAASLFFCMAPSKDTTRPVGEWNTARILCKGSVIEHWLNGERVLSFDYADPKWAWYVELLAARGGDLTGRNGQLWLQDHGQDVWFRNLRWRTIPANEVIEPEPYFEPMPVTGEALEKEKARVKSMLEAKAKSAGKTR